MVVSTEVFQGVPIQENSAGLEWLGWSGGQDLNLRQSGFRVVRLAG